MTIKECHFEALFRNGVPRAAIEKAHPNSIPPGAEKHVPFGTEEKWIYRLQKALQKVRTAKSEDAKRSILKPVIDAMLLVAEARNN